MSKQLSLSCSTSIRSLRQQLNVSRHPLVKELGQKLDDVEQLLQEIQQGELTQSSQVKAALYELQSKF